MDGPFKSQLEAAEHATEAEERRRGPRATYRWATQPIRDGVHEIRLAYERSPNWTKAVVILAVIGFAVALPSLLPYITADSVSWTFVLTKIGTAVLLALGLNVVVGFA